MFKGRHFGRSAILPCVRWYLACGLSLRDLKETMAERGISIDHSTIHGWVVHFSPALLERFNRRKRRLGSKWHMDETYIKVRGQWVYLYRAIDSIGDTVEFCALRKAFACRVSMQIAAIPASAKPLNSHCDSGPASSPMADYVVVMHRGRIVEEGPTDAIFEAPREVYTRTLIGVAPNLG